MDSELLDAHHSSLITNGTERVSPSDRNKLDARIHFLSASSKRNTKFDQRDPAHCRLSLHTKRKNKRAPQLPAYSLHNLHAVSNKLSYLSLLSWRYAVSRTRN